MSTKRDQIKSCLEKLGGGLKDYMLQTQLATKVIATIILLTTMSILIDLDHDNVALIAIFAGIAGSAATFLFAPKQ